MIRCRALCQTLLLLLTVCGTASSVQVSGLVLDPAGQPADQVDLDFVDLRTGENLPLSGDVTDLAGQYVVDVPPGRYRIRYRPPAGVPWAALEERDVEIAGPTARPDVTLQAGYPVSGVLLDSTGSAGVADADLDFFLQPTGNAIYAVRDDTDGAGAFSVVVPCGVYTVAFEPPPGHPDAVLILEAVDVACAPVDLGTPALPPGVPLEGTVTEAGTGNPVIDADLDVTDAVTGERIRTPHDDTDPSGFYRVVVPPGSYHIQVDPPRGSRALPAELRDTSVAGPTVQDFVLETGVLLEGTITSSLDGTVLEDVDLNVLDPATGENLELVGDRTDLDGFYRVAIPPGTWTLEYRPPAGSPFLARRLPAEPVPSDRVLDLALDTGLRLTGRVLRASDSTPVADADLDLIDAAGQVVFAPHDDTRSDGTFVLTAPAGTGYRLDVQPRSELVATSVEPVDLTADFTDLGDILLEDAVQMTGRLLRASDSSPVGGTDLDYFHETLGLVPTADDDSRADGTFSAWVPPGQITVEVAPAPGQALVALRVGPVTATLPGPLDLGDLLLEEAVFLRGTVVEAGSLAPLEGVDLDAAPPGAGPVFTPDDDTRPDGTFELRVPVGDYNLDVEPPAGAPHVARRLTVRAEIPEVDLGTIELESGALVFGRVVRAADATAVAEADLDFFHPARGLIYTPGDDTLADGSFAVRVPASSGYGIEIDPPPASALAPRRVEPVDIQAPETGLGDIVLETGLELTGTVRGPGGQPLEGVDLDVFPPGGSTPIYTPGDDTDASGVYAVRVPAGTYDLRVRAQRGSNLAWGFAPAVVVSAGPTVVDFDLPWLLAGVNPVSGPAGGGTAVTVTGTRLDDIQRISLGGSPLANVVVVDPNTLTGETRFHRDGLVDLTADYGTGELGILRDAFTYMPSPNPPLLLVSRAGPDVLLAWTDTGEATYTAARDDSPQLSAPLILFNGAGLQATDTGAVGAGRLLFYAVE